MSTYLKINENPDEITGMGAQIQARGTELNSAAQGILSEITTLEAGAPWGGDDTGRGFHKQYTHVPDGGGSPANESLKDVLAKAGKDLEKIGGGVMRAMVGYQASDQDSATDISRTKDK
jgi:uncharacterized protein YukE